MNGIARRSIRTAVVVVVGLFASVAWPGSVEPATSATAASGPAVPVAVRASLQSQLAGYLTTYGATEHVSAVSLSVSFRGRPGISLAAGTTRFGAGRAVAPDSLWQIGSNTKAFTSVLMLQLEAEHKLSINNTLGKWLPQYPAWSGVTIKQLLSMTSGIPNYTTSGAYWTDLGAAPNRKFSAPELVAYASAMPATHGYSYSNTNYILAEMIIERASHQSYATRLREQIIEPLGLQHTFYSGHDYGKAVTARMPAGYFFVSALPMMAAQVGQDQRRLTVSWAQAAGAIVSSLQDLGAWDRALFTGRLLPKRQQRELTSLVSSTTGEPVASSTLTDPQAYGLGVNQVTSTALGTLWYYEGETDGYRVVNVYAPASGTTIAFGVNSTTLTDNTGTLATSLFTTLHAAGLA